MSETTDETIDRLRREVEALKTDYNNFVYTITHDLIAPFRQIEGFANKILSNHGDTFDPKTKRHLGLIISGSEKGKEILDALLGYSRLISSDFSQSEINCHQLINEIETELSTLISDSAAIVSYENLPTITGDAIHVYQVFYQLIHNSLHYRKQGVPPVISIEAEENELEWKFSVHDNGIGFRDRVSDRIFIALRRGVSDKDYPGTGMGLTTAKAIIQRHGGKLWADSTPGTGSSFHFTLARERPYAPNS